MARVECYKGKFFAIECKAGKNKPTPLQHMNIMKIREAGGYAWVANEDNADEVEAVLLLIGEQDVSDTEDMH